ncbi:MAG: hypothetical protein QOI47_1283, partial [Actinomycetota bacterium]|nr:hypothetical protein [Actinomycetota bacterium]
RCKKRDSGCRWPGCGRTALLHAHHITWWTHGGPTCEENLVMLCWFHHRLVHEGGWNVEGDPAGRLRFIGPQRQIAECGPPGLRDLVRESVGLTWSGDPPGIAA